tara:strand:- start:3109 stop:5595 length:2487 start_codon:yes stop_codon:yes gene_type:complete
MDVKNLNENKQLIARDIMDAGIPPILAESNVDTRGRTHHLPFRLDEPIDVKEAHDPFAQYDMGNLNRPSPEGLEQFTLDSIRAGEPMKNAWSTLLKSKPYHEMSEQELNDIIFGLSGYDAAKGVYTRDETLYSQKEKDLAYQELLARQRETEANPVNVFGLNQEEKSRLVDFYEPQFSDTNISPDIFIPKNEKEGQAAYDFMGDGELEEHLDERLLDIDEFMPGKTFLSEDDPAQKYNHLLETAGREVAENYLNRYRNFIMNMSENPEYVNQRLMQMFDENQKITAPQYTQEFPTDTSIFDMKIPNMIMNEPYATGFEHDWQAKNASEPMDLSWRLLKEEIPYSSKDYPPQEVSISTGSPLVTPKVAGETPEICNMPGCNSGLPPVIYRRMANPIRSIDNHQFMCEQCAYKHDLQSLLFDKMIKGEITPMEYAMQLLKRELHPGRDIEGYLKDDGHYAGEEELYNLNDPEVQNFVNRLHLDKRPPEHLLPFSSGMNLGYVEPELRVENRDTKLYHPMMMGEHENLDKFPDRKIVEREDGTKEELVSTSDPTSDVVFVGRTGHRLVSPKPTFQNIPFSEETGFTRSEPMEIAMQLLKQEKSRGQIINEDLFLDYLGEKDLLHYDEMNDKQRAIIDAKAALPSHLFTEGTEMGENMNLYLFSRSMHENIPEHHYDDELEYLQHYNDALQPFLNNREKTTEVDGDGLQNHPEHPHNVAISRMHPNFKDRLKIISRLYSPNFQASEPMEIAMQLLKERVSPEAKRHKLEYDKKYESSPERVKYREELNRERRRRHIMGQGGPDMSHTARGTIVPESPHTNRARHFKDKGTLL